MTQNSFGARTTLNVGEERYRICRLSALEDVGDVARLPYSIKILFENLVRHEDGRLVTAENIAALARWPARR